MNSPKKHRGARVLLAAAGAMALLGLSELAVAVTPVVKAVPFVPGNPLTPHTIVSGQATRLKGTSSIGAGDAGVGSTVSWTWDTGGGSPASCSGTVTSTTKYAIECATTYTGSVGQPFTATLRVTDDATGDTATVNYFSQIQAPSLDTDVNISIDEGLWYLHKSMSRSTCSTNASEPCGTWVNVSLPTYSTSCGAITPANVTAFLVNGHSEGGAGTNPYTETVERGLNTSLEHLTAVTMSNQNTSVGTFSPDGNSNGIGLQGSVGCSDPPYQGGSYIDAFVATGTPGKTADAGSTASSGTEASIVQGRTYTGIVQDMADAYSWGQGDTTGGWQYGWYSNSGGVTDNSTNQWAAIGLIAAEREFGTTVANEVKGMNQISLTNTQQAGTGVFGYTSSSPLWGPYATTPSGMVQMAWQGIGRGTTAWDNAENYMRTNFCNTGGATTAPKDYYYGLFSFTKSMLLHDNTGGSGTPSDLNCLQNTGGANPFDWYGAESGQADTLCNGGVAAPCDGVARDVVGNQIATGGNWGAWNGPSYTTSQYMFTTAWSIIMLNRTVFASGVPVAVCALNPNPAVAGQPITLDGSASFHQDASQNIVEWEWDVDNDGSTDYTGAVVPNVSFPAVVDMYPVTLKVTDDSDPVQTNTTTCTLDVNTPPLAPTADANGPYVFCLGQNFFLDGTGSTNPDDGDYELPQPAGCPSGDSIVSYDWDLDGDGAYDDASGAQAEVTGFYTTVGQFNASLRVTDDTAACFPSSGFEDLTGFDVGEANVYALGADECECISDLFVRTNRRAISLNWAASNDPEAVSYNVYRGTTAGGPYSLIGNTTSPGYGDATVSAGTDYFYVVRPIRLDTSEICQSNEGSGALQSRRSR